MLCVFVACLAVAVTGQNHRSTEVHPCHNRESRFAFDPRDCKSFYRCFNQPPTRGQCPDDTLFHDERQTCVLPRNQRCFTCNRSVLYSVRSVHAACHQFAMCFNGAASVHACQNGLVFDGLTQTCNIRPANGRCNREPDLDDEAETLQCPGVQPANPLFFRATNSCSRFHVCSQANQRSVSRRCPGNLHFNLETRQCDLPQNARCQQVCRFSSNPYFSCR